MSFAEDDALAACAELAARLGMRGIQPRVVGRYSNLAVAFEPLPVIARVATSTALVRDAMEFAGRELRLTKYLAERRAPSVRACEDGLCGPHRAGAFVISLWQRASILSQEADAEEAGRRLAVCHRILRDDPRPRNDFGIFHELDRLLVHPHVQRCSSAADRAMVARQASDCRAALALLKAPVQTLHGDAHLSNVFPTPDGPVWADWEDTTYGPVEWDLACLVTGARLARRDVERAEQALEAYGSSDGAYDGTLLELMIHVRALYGAAWIWLLAALDPKRLERVEIWLRWLRAR